MSSYTLHSTSCIEFFNISFFILLFFPSIFYLLFNLFLVLESFLSSINFIRLFSLHSSIFLIYIHVFFSFFSFPNVCMNVWCLISVFLKFHPLVIREILSITLYLQLFCLNIREKGILDRVIRLRQWLNFPRRRWS